MRYSDQSPEGDPWDAEIMLSQREAAFILDIMDFRVGVNNGIVHDMAGWLQKPHEPTVAFVAHSELARQLYRTLEEAATGKVINDRGGPQEVPELMQAEADRIVSGSRREVIRGRYVPQKAALAELDKLDAMLLPSTEQP